MKNVIPYFGRGKSHCHVCGSAVEKEKMADHLCQEHRICEEDMVEKLKIELERKNSGQS